MLALPVSGDISRPQSSSSRSSCEYQQSPAAPEFVSPDYRADRRTSSGYFRSYNVQQGGGYYPSPSHYQGYNNTNGPSSGPAYRQNMQAGGEQGGAYSGYSSGYPSYPGYEGAGQEMGGYYQPQHQQHQPHTANSPAYNKSYGHHYPGYYPGQTCQGADNNTPLPPDFTYVGSGGGGGSEGNNQTGTTGYQDFYAC